MCHVALHSARVLREGPGGGSPGALVAGLQRAAQGEVQLLEERL